MHDLAAAVVASAWRDARHAVDGADETVPSQPHARWLVRAAIAADDAAYLAEICAHDGRYVDLMLHAVDARITRTVVTVLRGAYVVSAAVGVATSATRQI